MKFYKVTKNVDDEAPYYAAKKTDAHDRAKQAPSHLRDDVRIELVEIHIDQATVATILSKCAVPEVVQGTWGLTSRGGLRELPTGE